MRLKCLLLPLLSMIPVRPDRSLLLGRLNGLYGMWSSMKIALNIKKEGEGEKEEAIRDKLIVSILYSTGACNRDCVSKVGIFFLGGGVD